MGSTLTCPPTIFSLRSPLLFITTAQETGQLCFCFSSFSLLDYFSLKSMKQCFLYESLKQEEVSERPWNQRGRPEVPV
ncbi:hypothetical protein Peur_043609 [Populus x canadensis]